MKKACWNLEFPWDQISKAPRYNKELQPLLRAMKDQFQSYFEQWQALKPQIPQQSLAYYQEIADGMEITATRAKQVYYLYETVNERADHIITKGKSREYLKIAQGALDQGLEIVDRRRQNYRMPVEDIASWQYGPTAYPFQYLWAADANGSIGGEMKRRLPSKPRSPCFALNHR